MIFFLFILCYSIFYIIFLCIFINKSCIYLIKDLKHDLSCNNYKILVDSGDDNSTVETAKNDASRDGFPSLNNELFNRKQLLSCDLLSTHLSSPRNKSTFIQSISFLPNKE